MSSELEINGLLAAGRAAADVDQGQPLEVAAEPMRLSSTV